MDARDNIIRDSFLFFNHSQLYKEKNTKYKTIGIKNHTRKQIIWYNNGAISQTYHKHTQREKTNTKDNSSNSRKM